MSAGEVYLVGQWSWDRCQVGAPQVFAADAAAVLPMPAELLDAACAGRLTQASRIELTVSPDRRRHHRRREDRTREQVAAAGQTFKGRVR